MRSDPVKQQLVELDQGYDVSDGWIDGALADDGVIYCAPSFASRILAIDSFREFSVTIKDSMRLHPQELGRLFI